MTTTTITVTDILCGASFTGTPSDTAAWVRKLFIPSINNPAVAAFADALERGVATDADAAYLGLTVTE